jgi:hypothetical protein
MAAAQRQFFSNVDFYNFVDTIAERLRHCHRITDAERLHTLIHKVAWTTSTELFGELRIALRKTQETEDLADFGLASDITAAVETLDHALSSKGRSRHSRVPHEKT